MLQWFLLEILESSLFPHLHAKHQTKSQNVTTNGFVLIDKLSFFLDGIAVIDGVRKSKNVHQINEQVAGDPIEHVPLLLVQSHIRADIVNDKYSVAQVQQHKCLEVKGLGAFSELSFDFLIR